MVAMGMVSSIHLHVKSERIAPLIVCLVFYGWFAVNTYGLPGIPSIFRILMVGSVLSLCLAFLANVFTKVSIHGVGLGGLVGFILIFQQQTTATWLVVGQYGLNVRLIVMVAIVMAGLTATARLLLGAHTTQQVYLGLFLGLAGQVLALMVIS